MCFVLLWLYHTFFEFMWNICAYVQCLRHWYWVILMHDDVIKWKHFPRYWSLVREIHRSPVNSLHKGQWRGALMFSLICVRIDGWVNNGEAGDLRHHRSHYDAIVIDCKLVDKEVQIGAICHFHYSSFPYNAVSQKHGTFCVYISSVHIWCQHDMCANALYI